MNISDNYVAHLVLKGDVKATLEEKFDAVTVLQESGLFWQLPADEQKIGNDINMAYALVAHG